MKGTFTKWRILQITCNRHVYHFPDEKQKKWWWWFRTQSLEIVTITRYSCWRERPQWNLCSTASFECTHYRTYWCSYGPLGHWSEPGARFGTVGIVIFSFRWVYDVSIWHIWFMIAMYLWLLLVFTPFILFVFDVTRVFQVFQWGGTEGSANSAVNAKSPCSCCRGDCTNTCSQTAYYVQHKPSIRLILTSLN